SHERPMRDFASAFFIPRVFHLGIGYVGESNSVMCQIQPRDESAATGSRCCLCAFLWKCLL
ncbi:MAG: hypothetical protein ACR2OA_22240, partial [Rubripirellula sp.]